MVGRLVFTDNQGRPRIIIEESEVTGLSITVLDRQGVARLVSAFFIRHDGTGELAVVVLDRHGAVRAALALFLREDGHLQMFVGIEQAGVRRLLLIIFGRRAFHALLHAQQPLHLLRASVLILARPSPNLDRGGDSLRPAAARLTLDGWLLRLLHRAVLDLNVPPGFPPLDAAVVGLDGPLWFVMDSVDGLPPLGVDELPQLLPPLGVHGLPPLLLPPLGVHGLLPLPPLLPPLGVDGLPPLLLPPLGVHGLPPLPPPLAAAALDVDGLPAEPDILPPPQNDMDDEQLRLLEEGFYKTLEDWDKKLESDHVLSSDISNLLHVIFDLLKELERTEGNVDEGRLTEATTTVISELLNHMSERARSHIISHLALAQVEQREPQLAHPPQREPQLAHPPQQNNHWGMWRSFLTTIGFTIASNVVLYFLSLGMRLLEQSEEGSMQCVEPSIPERPEDARNKWVMKFIGWLVERIAAPVMLTWFVVLIREAVINNEEHMLDYEQNGKANVLVNGISRGFFLAIRGFPGIRNRDLWARLASTLIDVLGAAFLWWMGGHWDPDIADG